MPSPPCRWAANKIAFALPALPSAMAGALHHARPRGWPRAAVYIDPKIQPLATLFVGGVEADEMERAGAATMLAYGRDSLPPCTARPS